MEGQIQDKSAQEQVAELAAKLDALADKGQKHLPAWAKIAIAGIVAVLVIIGMVVAWGFIFGSDDAVKDAQHAESMHQALMRFVVALVVSWIATALSLVVLTLALDFMTCRREFLAMMRAGEASDLSMAVFTIGTAIYAGAIFAATLSALSV